MGTELRRAGLGDNELGELWNLTRPEKVQAIHKAYAEAGAEALLTNTFQANIIKSAEDETAAKLDLIVRHAVGLARAAGNPSTFVLGDVGPAETAMDLRIEENLGRVVQLFSGADAILLETRSRPLPSISAALATESDINHHGLPVLLSFTFRKDTASRQRYSTSGQGLSPEALARMARHSGIAALGVNCGREISIGDCAEIIRRYRSETDLPLFARPNAGTPVKARNQWVYPQTPEMMGEQLPELLEAGVSMIGGCCGTTAAHIAEFRKVIDSWNRRDRK
jgi:methionine synthase I (cobalamin-dependent)